MRLSVRRANELSTALSLASCPTRLPTGQPGQGHASAPIPCPSQGAEPPHSQLMHEAGPGGTPKPSGSGFLG